MMQNNLLKMGKEQRFLLLFYFSRLHSGQIKAGAPHFCSKDIFHEWRLTGHTK